MSTNKILSNKWLNWTTTKWTPFLIIQYNHIWNFCEANARSLSAHWNPGQIAQSVGGGWNIRVGPWPKLDGGWACSFWSPKLNTSTCFYCTNCRRVGVRSPPSPSFSYIESCEAWVRYTQSNSRSYYPATSNLPSPLFSYILSLEIQLIVQQVIFKLCKIPWCAWKYAWNVVGFLIKTWLLDPIKTIAPSFCCLLTER